MNKLILKIFISTLICLNFLPLESQSNGKYCKKEINNFLNELKLEIPKIRQPPIKAIQVIDINNNNRDEILITRDTYGGGNCCPQEIEIIYFNSRCNRKRYTLNDFDGVWNGWEDVDALRYSAVRLELRRKHKHK